MRASYDNNGKVRSWNEKFQNDLLLPFAFQVGIRRLLNNGTYCAAYPLHEGHYISDNPESKPTDRQVYLLILFAQLLSIPTIPIIFLGIHGRYSSFGNRVMVFKVSWVAQGRIMGFRSLKWDWNLQTTFWCLLRSYPNDGLGKKSALELEL